MTLERREERGPPSRAAARLYAIGDEAVDRLERQDDLYLDRTTIRAKRQAESAEDIRDRVQERAHREEEHQANMEWHAAMMERTKNNTAHQKRMKWLQFAGGCVALATSVLGFLHIQQVVHGTADVVAKLIAALG